MSEQIKKSRTQEQEEVITLESVKQKQKNADCETLSKPGKKRAVQVTTFQTKLLRNSFKLKRE